MGFSTAIKQEILVLCARHCCVCHKPKGINIEVHHIQPKHKGGEDTFENAIALCFECHADAGHYFDGHPKGIKLSPKELLKHKIYWFSIVKEHKIDASKEAFIELSFINKDFKPVFIREETNYINRDALKQVYQLLNKDPMKDVRKLQKDNKLNNYLFDPYLDKVKTYDDYLDYLSSDNLQIEDEKVNTSCQPVIYHSIAPFSKSPKEINHSNCVLNLKLKNYGTEVLENYKMYLYFDNVIEVDSVNKKCSFTDLNKYSYNIKFIEKTKCEFISERDLLFQNDSVNIDKICFRTCHSVKEVKLKWEIFARNIYSRGEITLNIEPQFLDKFVDKYIDEDKVYEKTIRILPKISFS